MEKKTTLSFKEYSIIMWVDEGHKDDTIIIDTINKLSLDYSVEYAYILHDLDTYSAEDYLKYINKNLGVEPSWKVGDPKPLHYHLYLSFDRRVSIDRISRMLNIPKNYIEHIHATRKYLRYLIHADDIGKHQYLDFMVQTNIQDFDYFIKFDDYNRDNNYSFAKFIYACIYERELCTFKEISKECIENGFSLELLRYSYFINNMLGSKK